MNTNGDITIAANTLMRCPAADSRCASALTGTGSALINNQYNMTYWDTDGIAGTFNSSSSNLTLPVGVTVLFAGLYWGADTSVSNNAAAPAPAPSPPNAAAPNAAIRNQVQFRVPGAAAYATITASQLDTLDAAQGGTNGTAYQGFADVTARVVAAGPGTYTVANVQAGTGNDRYAGWSLVVVYRDPAAPLRNLNVFDGYTNVGSSSPQTINVSGFLTPPVAPVGAKLGVVSYEGDLGTSGDQATLTSAGVATLVADAVNVDTNFANSTISRLGSHVTTKNPDVVNQLGYDADLFDATGDFQPSSTSATFRFSSTGDVYRPGVLTIAVNVFAPEVEPNFDKTVTDLNGGSIEPNDVLEYTLVVANTGQDDAVNSVLTDPIPTGAVYEPTSLVVLTGPNAGAKSDSALNDQAEFDALNNRVVFRLGVGANATAGGTITRLQTPPNPNSSTSVRFRVRVPPGTTNGTVLTNQASLAFRGFTLGENFTALSDRTSSTIVAAPNVAASKSVVDLNGGTAQPGDTLRYTVTLTNTGNEDVRQAVFNDVVDANTTVVGGSVSTSLGTVTAAGPTTVAVNLGTLARLGGGTNAATITFDVTIDNPVPVGTTAVANQGTVSGQNLPATPTNDPGTPAAGDPTVTPIVAAPILSATKTDAITKDVAPTGPSPGDELTYTVVLSNTGTTGATGVVFTDTPDPNAPLDHSPVIAVTTTQGTVTSGNAGADNAVAVDVGTIGAGATVTITIRTEIASPLPAGVTQVANQGTVSGTNVPSTPTNDPDTPADGDTTVTPVTADPLVTASKSDAIFTDADGNGVPSPGDTLSYTVTIQNNGNGAATGLTFTDTPDPNAPLVAGSVTTSNGTVTSSIGSVGVSIGTLPGGGGTATVSFRVQVVSPLPAGVGSVSNQGTVSGTNVPATPTDDPDTPADVDPTVTGLTANPIVTASKSDTLFDDADSNGVPSPGDTIAYTVTVQNNGNGAATGLTFTDTPDPNAPLVVGSVVASQGAVTSGNTAGNTSVGVTLGTLPGGGTTATISFRAVITDPLPAGVTSVANQGTVSGTNVPATATNDPDTGAAGDPTITGVVAAPLVSASKAAAIHNDADGNGVPSPGDTLIYTVTIQNNGNGAATGITFADTPDSNAPLVTGSVVTSQGLVTSSSGSVGVDVGTVPGGGATVTLSFRVLVANPLPPAVTSVANQGTVSGANVPVTPTNDPDTPAAGDPTVTPLTAAPVVAATKTDSLAIDADANGLPSPGDTLAYTVTLQNTGNGAATSVVVADTPDPNAPLIVGSVVTSAGTVTLGNTAGNSSVQVNVGTIPGGGGTAIVSFRVQVASPLPGGVTSVTNQATFTATGIPATTSNDPDTAAEGDPTVTALTADPSVSVTKSDALLVDADGNGVPSPGDTLAYTVTIQNDGNAAATGVTFDDPPNASAPLVVGSVATSQGAVTSGNTAGNPAVAVTLGTIPGGGGAATVSFHVTIDDPLPAGVSTVSNQGTVNGANIPTTPTDDPDTLPVGDVTVTPVTASPLVTVTKDDSIFTDADGNGAPSPGDTLLYSVILTNNGTTAATGVQVADTPDTTSPLVAGSVQTSQGVITSNAVTVGVDVGTIAGRGGSATITFRVLVANPLPDNVTALTNQGTVTGANIPTTPTDDPATAAPGDPTVTSLLANPVIVAEKVAAITNDVAPAGPSPGDDLTYTITITNSGNKNAAGTVFADIPDVNAPLLVGTVNTTGGTVAQGNTAGNTAVRVNVGAIPGNGGSVTISFTTRIVNPAPAGLSQVDNQGTVTGANFAAAVTDDPGTVAGGDPTVTPITAAPIVLATKSVAIAPGGDVAPTGPSPGDTLLYTVVLQNSGNGAATGVTFADTPDTNSPLVGGSVTTTQGTIATAGAGFTVNVGTIPGGGATVTITFQVTIADPVPAGTTQVANQGSVSGTNVPATPTDDPGTGAADDPTVTPITAAPDVTVTKADALVVDADGNGVASPGDTLLYTVTATNTGNGAATGVIVRDIPDPNAPLLIGSVNTSQGTINNGNATGDSTVFVTIGTLAGRGGTATVTFQARIANPLPAGVTQIANQALVTGGNIPDTTSDDPASTTGGDPTVTPLSAAPVLSATKTKTLANDVAPAGPSPGDTLTFTVTITNSGNQSATGVTYSDVPDANAPLVVGTVVSSPTGTVTSGNTAGQTTVGVDVGAIAGGGGQVTISYNAVIASPLPAGVTQVDNQGVVAAANAAGGVTDDPTTPAGGDPTVTQVTASPELSASKSAALFTDFDGNGVPSPGDQLSYTVTVTNSGNQTATGVTYADIPDANAAIIAGSVATTLGTVTTGNAAGATSIGVNVGDLPGGGGSVTITYRVTVGDLPATVATISNQGVVSAANAPSVPTDDPASPAAGDPTVLALTAAPRVEVTKAVALFTDVDGNGSPSPGDRLAYTITVRNTGNQAASAVTLSDVVDTNLSVVAASVQASQGTASFAGSTVSGTLGTIAARGTATVTFRAVIESPLPAGVTQVANQANVSGGNFPHTPSDDPASPAAGDPTVTPIVAAPVVSATKSDVLIVDADGNGSPSPGDTLLYTVTVRNTGNQAATGALANDLLDPNVAIVPGSVQVSQGTVTSGNGAGDTTIAADFGDIPGGGGTATLTFRVTIDNPLPAGVTQVTNQATVTGGNFAAVVTDDPDTPAAGDPTVTPITANPAVEVTKADALLVDADANGVPSPGDTLGYTVTITNSGNLAASDVAFSDVIDPNLTVVAGTLQSSQGSVALAGSTISGNLGLVFGGGATATVSWRATIRNPLPAGVTQVANQASVTGGNFPGVVSDDPATGDPNDPTVTPLTANPAIAVTKTDTLFTDIAPAGPSPGDTLLYTVTVTNSGNQAATNVAINDVIDPNLTVVGGSLQASQGTVTLSGATISGNLGTIPGGGASATVTWQATVANPLPAGVTQVTNQATVSGENFPSLRSDDPATAAAGDPTVTPLTANPVVAATKADSLFTDADGNGVPSPGDTLLYTVQVTNSGNQAASAVAFSDVIDTNVTVVAGSVTSSQGSVALAGSTISGSLGTIPGGGASATVSWRATIASPVPAGVTQVTNQASVSGGNFAAVVSDDPATGDPNDPTVTPLTANPVVAVTKTDALFTDVAPAGPSPGDTLLYTVTVTNTGNQAASGVAFSDIVDPNVAVVAGTLQSSQGSVALAGATISGNLGTIPGGGATATVTWRATVDDPLPAGVTQVANQATISGANFPATVSDDPATAATGDPTVTPLTANPVVALTKADTLVVDVDGNGVPSPGDTLLYTATVTNSGNQAASAVAFNDVIEANLTVVGGSLQSSQGSVALAAGTISGNLDTIPGGGGTATVTWRATIVSPLPAGVTQVANQATVTGGNFASVTSDDPATGDPNDPTVTPLTANPVVAATKTDALVVDVDGNGVPSPGDTLQYTVTVTNSGNQAAAGVAFSDVIDANLTVVGGSVVASQGAVALAGATLAGTLGTIPGGGGSATVSWRATIANPLLAGVTQVANQATLTGANFPGVVSDDPASAAGGDATVTPLTANPVIAVSKTDTLFTDLDGNGTPSPGDTLLYTITIVNSGNQAGVASVLNDVGDPNVAFVPGSVQTSQGTITSGNGVGDTTVGVDVGVIPGGGGTATVTFRVVVDDPLPAGVTGVSNSAIVSGGNFPATSSDDPSTAATGDPTTTALTASPVVGVTKEAALAVDADGNGVPSPGDTLLYTVIVQNTGNQAAAGVAFSDVVDPNLAIVAGSIQASQGSLSAAGQAISGTLDTIPGGGASATIGFRVTVANPLPAGVTQVANQATVTGANFPSATSDDPSTPAAGDPTVTPLTAAPVVSATKAAAVLDDVDGNGLPSPGDTLLYTVVVQNTGNQAATGLSFADTPDANAPLIVGSVATSVGSVTSGNGAGQTSVGVDLGTLPGGGAGATITFRVTVVSLLPAGVTSVSNQGTITGANIPAPVPTDNPNTLAGGDPTVTALTAAPLIFATKSDSVLDDADGNGRPSPGDTLVYTVVIQNTGNQAASTVTFADTPDANAPLVTGSVATSLGTVTSGNTAGDTSVGVDVGTLPGGGASAQITFNARIPSPLPLGITQIANQGNVTGGNFPTLATDDPATAAPADTTVTGLTLTPRLVATKDDTLVVDADGNGIASPGDEIRYDVVVQNTGNVAVAGVAFTDTPDVNSPLIVGSVTTSAGTVTVGNAAGATTVGVDLGVLPGGGASATISFRVRIVNPIPAGVVTLSNQGQATAPGAPPAPTDDPGTPTPGDPTVTALTATPIITSAKSVALVIDADRSRQVSPGDTVRYVIAVGNTGNRPATGLRITDGLSAAVELVAGSLTTSRGSIVTGSVRTDRSVVVDVPTLNASEGVVVAFSVRVRRPLPTSIREITNQAIVSGNNFPQAVSDDPATAAVGDATRIGVAGGTRLVVRKFGPLRLAKGNRTSYSIRITNQGPNLAAGIVVTDTLPAGISLAGRPRGATVRGRTVTWRIAQLEPGRTIVLTLPVRVTGAVGQRVVNRIRVNASNIPRNIVSVAGAVIVPPISPSPTG